MYFREHKAISGAQKGKEDAGSTASTSLPAGLGCFSPVRTSPGKSRGPGWRELYKLLQTTSKSWGVSSIAALCQRWLRQQRPALERRGVSSRAELERFAKGARSSVKREEAWTNATEIVWGAQTSHSQDLYGTRRPTHQLGLLHVLSPTRQSRLEALPQVSDASRRAAATTACCIHKSESAHCQCRTHRGPPPCNS